MGTLVLPRFFENAVTGKIEKDSPITPLEALAHVLNGASEYDAIKGYELIKNLREQGSKGVSLDTTDLEKLDSAINNSKISQFAKAQLLYAVKRAKKE